MLYDIAPPLLFFGSLGGIILVVSRVLGRIRRRKFSRAIQAEGSRASEPAQELLNPNESKITLMKSRLAAVGESLKASVRSLKEIPTRLHERRAAKAQQEEEKPALRSLAPAQRSEIQPPRSSWREQLLNSSRNISQRLRQAISRRASAAARPPVPTPSKAQEIPRVSLRRTDVESPAAKPRTETTAQRLQAFVKKQRATTSPVEEAQAATKAGNLDRAEDILVPYIAQHPHNTQAYMTLGDVALAQHSWDEAVEIFEQVLRLDKETPSAYAKLGEACLGSGRVTRALEALQRAHDLEEENVTILKQLLNIARHTDNQVLQKSVVQKLVVLAPGDPEVHLAADALEAREEERETTPTAQG